MIIANSELITEKQVLPNLKFQTAQGMPEPMAQQRWLVELANAEPGRLNAARTELLWPVEKFVMDFSEKAHSEKVEIWARSRFAILVTPRSTN